MSRSASGRARRPTPAIFCITDIDPLNSRDTRNYLDISFDPAKRAETLKHRGLDFADAGAMFAGRTVTVQDMRRAFGEDRFITAGHLGGR